jgi:serine O-acetyltransferase
MKDREVRIDGLRELVKLIREDRSVNFGWGRPGLQALAVHRLGVYKSGLRWRLVRLPFALVHWFAYGFVRNFYGIELPAKTRIGRRVVIGHQHGIIVHPEAAVGDDCILRQGVTLGQRSHRPGPAPKLGNRVEIGAGAVLVGSVTVEDRVRVGPNAVVMTSEPTASIVVGNGVHIGPNAVVMTNVPAGAIVSAPPAQISTLPSKWKTEPA